MTDLTTQRTHGEADDAEHTDEPGLALGLSTAPTEDAHLPRLSPWEMTRWAWRQLTSMRIALILLFLLSLASLPGSLLPQRPVNPSNVSDFFTKHKFWAPILNHLGAFTVFESPWFAAIYLLLFISLVGCIVPRARQHFRAMRTPPPRAPRNLDRLPAHRRWATSLDADAALTTAAAHLRRRRFRVTTGTDAAGGYVSAEKGYLREIGNLLFHVSLLGIFAAIAVGHFFGYKGSVLVSEGNSFADTLAGYASFTPGTYFNASELPPFSIRLDKFDVTYQTSGDQTGSPRAFDAHVLYQDSPTAPARHDDLRVNHPVVINGVKVFLEGHGYSPEFTIRDGRGNVVDSGPQQFFGVNNDGSLISTGVVKAPDAQPEGIGLTGTFLPTEAPSANGPTSTFPAADNPRVVLNAWAGDLGMNNGVAQNVYVLDTSHMKQLRLGGKNNTAVMLAPGQTVKLPGGLGSVTFDGVKQWAQFNVAYDPGEDLALGSAVAAVVGLLLSLGLRRRRVWIRVAPRDKGGTSVAVGGLARSESSALTTEIKTISKALRGELSSAASSRKDSAAPSSARGGQE